MPYRLILDLDGLPKMDNPSGAKSTHWRYAHKEATYWKQYVAAKVPFFAKPLKPLERAKLTLIRFSSSEPDFGGIVRGFKHIIDGLVEIGVLEDDKYSNTGVWNCHWEKTGPKQGRVKVIVDEV